VEAVEAEVEAEAKEETEEETAEPKDGSDVTEDAPDALNREESSPTEAEPLPEEEETSG
jgi:hypothetical protein